MIRTRTLSVVLATTGLALYGFGAGHRAEGAARQDTETISVSGDVGSGEIGRVLDREGVAARRGVLDKRWRPVDDGTALAPGDWIEVGSRGANALKVRMTGGAELTLGPGTLAEVKGASSIELARGELLVDGTRMPTGSAAPEEAGVEVAGPGETTIRVAERAVLRARDGKLIRLDETPRWLVGYEAGASTEAMGSLLANVDGRNVPLTIGYHKVTVDIRDQIARTVIEESFENHTSTVLEGVFYFPLPADASISGFGMWIGGELVQGDIVEKQRAREIYETILREKRDPGLLEWTGGNVFKARIYPIGAEKRIRIAYTQVLPKNGDTYAYHYALQSELLRKTPLRRLEIEVNVSSAEALASVESPSHACRVRTTEHASKVEFTVEEFAPERDFELRVQLQPQAESLTLIPHQRGDDGYFMLLVDAPPITPVADVPTDVVEPIEVLILADTSASMWGAPRANQTAFIEALIASLSPRDTVNLATVDVETRWAFERPLGNHLENREEALRFLEQRDPLGWTDLERAFTDACERASDRTHVVYVGDGVPTTAAADPVELAHELGRRFKGQGTFHAVIPGPSSEMTVLRALAGLGGGSVRSIGGGTDPTQTAFALIEEIGAPAVKDLQVTFEGLAIGAVYPKVLPNLTAGGQQIVVGRFDPLGPSPSEGRVRVTGTMDGEPVSFEREVTLATNAEDGEDQSFIPRLWARHHLDHLLDQGSSSEVQERIIALSEDYQIVTPYSSFLVLESDADRERFGVKQRFRMRDGEEFFTAGREAGRHELERQQMLAAQSWRKEVRDRALAALESMGRELTELLRGQRRSIDQVAALGFSEFKGNDPWDGRVSGSRDFLGHSENGSFRGQEGRESFADEKADYDFMGRDDRLGESDMEQAYEEEMPAVARERMALKSVAGDRSGLLGGRAATRQLAPWGGSASMQHALQRNEAAYGGTYGDPFGALFPAVGSVRDAAPLTAWPLEVQELLERIDRRNTLANSPSGWRFATETTWTGARGREQTSRAHHLIGPDHWVSSGGHVDGNAYPIEWVENGQRGVLREGWRLGRVRAAEPEDPDSWPAPFALYFGDHLRSYSGYDAEVVERSGTTARIRFRAPGDETNAFTLDLDTAVGVILELSWTHAGEVQRGQTFEDFHRVDGSWWPKRIRSWTVPSEGQAASPETITKIAIEVFETDAFAGLVSAQLAPRENAILLNTESPRVADAKEAVRSGSAGIEERWLLLRYYAQTQRWKSAAPHFQAFAAAAAGKPGLDAIRLTWLQQSRRNEELFVELLRVASELSETPRYAEFGQASDLLQYSYGLNPGNELSTLLQALHPVYVRQDQILDAELGWDQRWLQALANLGRPEALLSARREAAGKWPLAVPMQTAFAQALAQNGEVDGAMEWLAAAEAAGAPWQPYERTQFRQSMAEILWGGYRLEQWIRTFEAWEHEDPAQLDANLINRYLSGLIFLDREREAWTQIETWLAYSRDAEREPLAQARLHAAIQHGLGQGHLLYHLRFDDARAQLLADTARALIEHDGDTYLAGWILQHWLFHDTDAGRSLLAELYDELESDLADLSAQRVLVQIGWLRGANYQPEDGEEAWQVLFETVFQRWTRADLEPDRTALAQVVQAYGAPELRIRFVRELLARAESEPERVAAAQQLSHELRQQPWSRKIERELASLLTAIGNAAEEDASPTLQDMDRRTLAIHDFVDWILWARTGALLEGVPDYESMTRSSLRAERARARRIALSEAAERMLELEQELTPPVLRDWAAVEHIFLQVSNNKGLDAAWDRSFELLRGSVAAILAAQDPEDVTLRERILAERCIATCTLLLMHTDAKTLEERKGVLIAELSQLIESGSEFPDGRLAIRTLLVAQDDAVALESVLAGWFSGGEEFAMMRWGRDYAHLLAERGDLEAAAGVLEEVERIDELTSEDYDSLADWYTALDLSDRSREMHIRAYEVMGEDQLANELYRLSQTYARQGQDVPPELDPEVPLRLLALMRKARDPQNRFWVLQNLYLATKDYRLLECLPAAVIGHSAQSIYPLLHRAASLAEAIDEEATVDRIQAHLAELRESVDTGVDRRALALLQFQVVSRAARQAHGAERHSERSLSALTEAFQGEWETGEVALMAKFLASQGRLQPDALAAEQLRQLRALSHLATDPDERLAVAHALGRTLWAYAELEPAVQVLEAGLNERREVTGRLPQVANEPLRTLSSWLVAMQSFRHAESIWLNELAGDHPEQQALWLKEQLFELYRDAVLSGGELSLGAGEELYTSAVEAFSDDLATRTTEQHAQRVVAVLCDLWRRAHHELHLTRVAEDARGFAFGALPSVLRLYQYRSGQSLVTNVAECLERVRGAQTAVEFFVVRAENEPSWLRLQSQDFWQQHAWRFGEVLAATIAKNELTEALAGRALAVVLAELRADLTTRQSRNRTVYDERHGRFWADARQEFVSATLAFLEDRGDSPHAVAYAAEYLFRGLSAHAEATDALFASYRRGDLHLEGRDQLATYLQERGRWSESIPLAAELVLERPAEARYRVMLMLGQFHEGDLAACASTFATAETWFRENHAWEESGIATLAEGCLRTQLFQNCVRLYDDAIALRVRTAPRRGVGDGVLCTYYRYQSGAYSGLGLTDDAVDAASGAVVSWGQHISQREAELGNLQDILGQAEDLEGFVARLDVESRTTGLENPILRKALGQVYLGRGDNARAALQLKLALAAQPNDTETHQLLMSTFESMQRNDLAAESLLEWSRAAGHELHLYADLGQRFLRLDQAERSERAFTTLVELSPHESEGQHLLAEIRERQNRWEEALNCWRAVARIRTKEPTGHLGLARALLHLERVEEAREVIDHLRGTSWPARYGDVRAAADTLAGELD